MNNDRKSVSKHHANRTVPAVPRWHASSSLSEASPSVLNEGAVVAPVIDTVNRLNDTDGSAGINAITPIVVANLSSPTNRSSSDTDNDPADRGIVAEQVAKSDQVLSDCMGVDQMANDVIAAGMRTSALIRELDTNSIYRGRAQQLQDNARRRLASRTPTPA